MIRPCLLELEKRLLHEPQALIQVLMGPRQVGKTTAITQFLERNPQRFPHSKVQFTTGDEGLSLSPHWLEAQWQEAKMKGPGALLVIDEIQKIMDWSGVVKKLWDQEIRTVRKPGDRLKVVLLGSSSLELQHGLTESLTGRFELVRFPHWSYPESRAGFGLTLEQFMLFGGYPGSYAFLSDPKRWSAFVRDSIIETVIGKDILSQSHVKNVALFRQSFDLLCNYPAQEISYTKLLGQLQEKGNVELVKNYIHLFEGAFLFRALQKYSSKTMKVRASSPKILPLCPALYAVSLGWHSALDSETRGRLLEVCVGSALNNLSGSLFYWREKDHEMDFVYREGREVFGIEVKSGRVRHSKSIQEFKARFRGSKVLMVTADNFPEFSENPDIFLRKYSV